MFSLCLRRSLYNSTETSMLKLLRSGPCWSHALSTSSTHPRLLQFSQPHGADDSSFKRNGRGVGWRSPLCDPIRLRAASVSFGTCSEEEEGEEEEEDEEIRRAESVAERLARVKNEEDEQLTRELSSLNVAIIVNVIILFSKLAVFLVSGSSAMLSEALHSAADTLNQFLLRVGVLKSLQAPTVIHPYGYTRDRFVWSLISAVGIFFLGAGASFFHGLHTLFEHKEVVDMGWNYIVLGLSAVLEGYSLWVASRHIAASAAARKMPLWDYLKSGTDPTTVAVLLEDGGAILGLIIAAASTALCQWTGSAMWDAVGSMLVGLLLGAIATFLVAKNRQLLIGRSMAPADVQDVMAILRRDPVVSYVKGTMTEEIGPRIYRFKAEVAWNGAKLTERYLARCNRDKLVRELTAATQSGDQESVDAVLKDYGRDIISSVGAEVDRIENEIQTMNPGIRYVDLETDRGKRVLRPRRKTSRGGSLPDSSSGTPSYCNTTNPTAADAAAASATSTSYGTHGSEDRSASSSLPWHSGSSEHTSGDSQGMGSAEQIAGKGQGMDSNYLFGSLSSLSSLDECEKLGDLPDVYSFTNGSVANGEGPSTKFSSPEAPSAPTKVKKEGS